VAAAPGSPAVARHTAAPPPAPADQTKVASGLPLPPGRGVIPTGREGSPKSVPSPAKNILASLDTIERKYENGHGADGMTTGAVGQQMGPLFFDPEGADFTSWINHFKNEVYRNWIVPQAVMLGFHGEVAIEFTIARDGSLHDLKVLSGSGTSALDRAAVNSLTGSRFLPLPADYGPPQVTMRVTFHYNDGPRRS
jgi:TonB family protein